jgi:hypothetical protein
MLHRVGDDLIPQRRADRGRMDPGRAGFGKQPRLAVAVVALSQLVQPRPGTPDLPGRLHHRDLATRHPIQRMLPQPCQAVRRSHGHLASVSCQTDRARLSMVPFALVEARRVSGLILVSKS